MANTVYLSDLIPAQSFNGWGSYERDRSNGEQGSTDGGTLTLNGITYAKGLGVHSYSSLTYTLGGSYSLFQSFMGIDDEVGLRGSVIFRVLADGVEIFESGILTGASASQFVDLDVTGVQTLQLIVENADGSAAFDHANWADAKLINATTPTATPPSITLAASTTQVIDPNGSVRLLRDTSTDLVSVQINGVSTPLSFQGSQVKTNQFSGWQILAAETVGSNQNQILWKELATGRFHFWSVDSNWNYISSGAISDTSSSQELLAQQQFMVDPNGIPLTTQTPTTNTNQVIDPNGSVRLLRDTSTDLVSVQINGVSTPLSFQGSQVKTNQFSGWQILAAETVGSNQNQILWKELATGRFHFWSVDSNWNYISSGAISDTSSSQELLAQQQFMVDPNGIPLTTQPPATNPNNITLAVNSASVLEDGTANLVYTLTRSSSTSSPLSVNYTVGGSATNGSDYTGITTAGTSKTVTFLAGSATATVTVNPSADSTFEPDETVFLTLAPGSGYTIGTTGAVTGTISNDDVAPLPSITLALAPGSVLEDGSTNLVYTFTRTGDLTNALTVNYTLGGTASNGSDFTGISTNGSSKSVTFLAGSATTAVTVNPTADTTVEPDETVVLTLAAGTGYTIGTTGAVSGTISNDDTDPITGAVPGSFREDFDGTTVNNQVWQVATWAEHGGQTGTERVFVRDGYLHMVLVNDAERGILSSAIQTWDKFGYGRWEARLKPSDVPGVLNSFFTIDWDDFSTPNIPADGTKQEIDIEFLTRSFTSDSGEVHFAVHEAGRQSMNTNPDIALNFNPSAEFHVYGFDIKPDRIEWLLDGQAVYAYEYAKNDITIDSTYQLKLNTWTATDWIGGPPEQNIESTYMIDWIQFTPYTGSTSNQIVATLPSITLALAPGSVQEDGSTNLVYTFTRSGDLTNALTVNYALGGTASNGSDFTGISTNGSSKSVTFLAGSATTAVTVNPTADTTVEPDETVVLTLAAGTGYTIGTTGAVSGTISNDDTDPITGAVPGSFREDFDGTTVNNQVWQVATWAEHGGQTGTERVFVRDGYLHMVLVNDAERGILSSAIQTWDKFGYGRWEARLKPSDVPGVLNSFFTIDWDDFSTPNIPADGTKQEIDIEFLTRSFTSDSGEVHFAVHEAGRQSMNTNPDIALNFNPSAEFHVYGFDIKPDRIEWLLDGQAVYAYEYAKNDITIDSTYQLKLNTWTATDWIGGPPEQNIESTYMIDWIQFTPYTGSTSNQIVATLPSITLALAPGSVQEDGSTNLVYTFTRSGDLTNALTVNYALGGTASNGSDFTGISTNGSSKSVTFLAGSATTAVTVNPTADTTVEPDETVVLTLAAGTGYTIGTTGAVSGTISNDDVAPLPSITLALAPGSVLEDGSTNLVYTFTRTGDLTNALTVNYTLGGTASNGSDFTGISTNGSSKSVTFLAGSATTAVTVNPTADTTVEPDETVVLTLAAGTGYTIGTTGAVSGTISNDDQPSFTTDVTLPPPPTTGWTVNENNIGLAAFGIEGEELPVYTGPYEIPAGSVITGMRFTKPVSLYQGNIIIEKSLFQPTSSGWGKPIVTTTNYNGNAEAGRGKVIIRDSEFDGSLLSDEIAAYAFGFLGIADLQRNYFHDLGSGIGLMNTGRELDSLIEHNYVTDTIAWGSAATTGNHVDAFTIRDFTDAVRPDRVAIIRNNRFDADAPRNVTGALFIQAWSGRIDNVMIEGNLLEGRGYNLALESKHHGYNNISAINNRFVPSGWGTAYYSGGEGWSTWQDNYILDPSNA